MAYEWLEVRTPREHADRVLHNNFVRASSFAPQSVLRASSYAPLFGAGVERLGTRAPGLTTFNKEQKTTYGEAEQTRPALPSFQKCHLRYKGGYGTSPCEGEGVGP